MKTKTEKWEPRVALTLNKRTIASLNQREMAYVGGLDAPPPDDTATAISTDSACCSPTEMGITPSGTQYR